MGKIIGIKSDKLKERGGFKERIVLEKLLISLICYLARILSSSLLQNIRFFVGLNSYQKS